MREVIWVRQLIKDISNGFGIPVNEVTDIKATVYEDIQAAISNANRCANNIRTFTFTPNIGILGNTLEKNKVL